VRLSTLIHVWSSTSGGCAAGTVFFPVRDHVRDHAKSCSSNARRGSWTRRWRQPVETVIARRHSVQQCKSALRNNRHTSEQPDFLTLPRTTRHVCNQTSTRRLPKRRFARRLWLDCIRRRIDLQLWASIKLTEGVSYCGAAFVESFSPDDTQPARGLRRPAG